jgi:hypothetical protein
VTIVTAWVDWSLAYYHGTKVDLRVGDLIAPGYASNYGKRKQASFVYLTATLDAAIWGAELAAGDGKGRIYVVEPTGAIEDDPNLTNKRFPGNPTKSYRSRLALRVVGEVCGMDGTLSRAPEGDARPSRKVETAGDRSDRGMTPATGRPFPRLVSHSGST